MQAYCYEALKYSREKVKPEETIKRVTIFLNPIANKERGKYVFDKNVAPLLNLSGLDVRLIRLEKNSEANEYMKEIDMNDTDMIVVAGGNATLNEVIKGLVDRPDSKEFLQRIPVAILPIGETNRFARKWFSDFKSDSNRDEFLLFADAAMSILKGTTQPVDLLKITLNKNENASHSDDDTSLQLKKKGAYTLMKDNKIYALSSFACGFVTIIDANLDSYWYYGFDFLKKRMNKYFSERFLRRNPFTYNFTYKLSCDGCSNCLNKEKLQKELLELTTGKVESQNSSLMHVLIKKITKITHVKKKEDLVELKRRIEKLSKLIEFADNKNIDCDKIQQTSLKQVQIYSSINNPNEDEYQENHKHIDTVVVKDPEFNQKDMFLASRKYLKEFELKKNSNLVDKEKKGFNYFAIEIDGELYKLHNLPEDDLKIHVELVENCINLIKFDSELSHSVKSTYLQKIYLLSRRTLEEYFLKKKTLDKSDNKEMPPVLPFEKFYLNYWKPN